MLLNAVSPVVPREVMVVIERVLGGMHTLGMLEETVSRPGREASPLVENGHFFPERCFLKNDPAVAPYLMQWTKNMLRPGSGITGSRHLVDAVQEAHQGHRILGLGRHLELAGVPFLRLIFEKLQLGKFFDDHSIFLTGQKLSSEEITPAELPEMVAEKVWPQFLQDPLKRIMGYSYPALAASTAPRPVFPTLMGIVNQFRFFTKRDTEVDGNTKSAYLRSVMEHIKKNDPWRPYPLLFLYPMAGCERGRPPTDVDENFVNMLFRGTPITPRIDRVFLFNEGGEIARHPPERGKNLLTLTPEVSAKRMAFGPVLTPEELLSHLVFEGFVPLEIVRTFRASGFRAHSKEIAIGIEKAIRAMPLR